MIAFLKYGLGAIVLIVISFAVLGLYVWSLTPDPEFDYKAASDEQRFEYLNEVKKVIEVGASLSFAGNAVSVQGFSIDDGEVFVTIEMNNLLFGTGFQFTPELIANPSVLAAFEDGLRETMPSWCELPGHFARGSISFIVELRGAGQFLQQLTISEEFCQPFIEAS